MHYAVERSVLSELAKEIESWAAIERAVCQAEDRSDCPANEKQGRVPKGTCSDEVKSVCHGLEE